MDLKYEFCKVAPHLLRLVARGEGVALLDTKGRHRVCHDIPNLLEVHSTVSNLVFEKLPNFGRAGVCGS